MSELKEHQFCESDEFFREYTGPLSNETHLYYLKSEADKVIAELKAEKEQAEDDCAYWKTKAQRECHHKYKRCLDKAARCAAECVVKQNTYKGFQTHKSEFRIGHFRKWYFRWLELAEKFKEAK